MKNKILLYLFIFMFLFALFIYINDKRILDSKQQQIEQLEEKVFNAEVKLEQVLNANRNLSYFSLLGNEQGMSYFEDMGIDAERLTQRIKDEIISRNKANEDNPLVPFEGIDGVMRVNKIMVLNHKWVITDFTDGTYWGEMLLSYEMDEQSNLLFTTEKSFLYPIN